MAKKKVVQKKSETKHLIETLDSFAEKVQKNLDTIQRFLDKEEDLRIVCNSIDNLIHDLGLIDDDDLS